VPEIEVPPGVKPGSRNVIRLARKMSKAVLTKKEIFDENGRLGLFTVKPVGEPEIPEFVAGQYTSLALEVGPEFYISRPYSIASSPNQKDSFEFFIALVEDGALTPHMFKSEVGDTWLYYKCIGKFTLQLTERKKLFFISTGTGLAPFRSIAQYLNEQGELEDYSIISANGVSYLPELGYREEHEALEKMRGDHFLYIPTVSRPADDHPDTVSTGRVNEVIRKILGAPIAEGRPDPHVAHGIDLEHVRKICPPDESAVFLCGNPDMIEDLKEPLANVGYDEIHVEEYW